MLKEIPIDSSNPAYDFDIDLDGESYNFDLHFNTRSGYWYFTISKSGEAIVSGIRLTLGTSLIEKFRAVEVPQGPLFIIDESGQNIPPTRDDLGIRVKMYYDDLT